MAVFIPTLSLASSSMQTTVRAGPLQHASLPYEADLRSSIRLGLNTSSTSPHDSLVAGRWVKLICGASFEDVADVRNLSLVYTLAGVDCIDCAAESSVVRAVKEGIDAAVGLAVTLQPGSIALQRPWIMVSINDDEDVHFRKAVFDSSLCPTSCPRPCECICPASAIMLSSSSNMTLTGGVLNDRCYGCGRCITVCPLGLIGARSYTRNYMDVADLLESGNVDAIEIHTNARDLEAFKNLWRNLCSSIEVLKLVAVSLPDLGDDMQKKMGFMYDVMKPDLKALNLWQLDGRPMSGDIGAGATKAVVRLATKVLAYTDRPPGFLQLAGGTNFHTVRAMETSGLFEQDAEKKEMKYSKIAGIAYGGYARKILSEILSTINQNTSSSKLEDFPLLLVKAVREANLLVSLLKER
ncbi:hypothetical protein KP509_16G052400 [Ceratopteris richardii]|uniref:4Fe-4S ferredoxin-type domain-containing protein n=1 Tax=Ceratopteris richardii TaxID=49495 RepID=A0A8T2T0B8_CERRI|nr:hypothetical protein KP509_16G052400 [Ceratopteris richardii]